MNVCLLVCVCVGSNKKEKRMCVFTKKKILEAKKKNCVVSLIYKQVPTYINMIGTVYKTKLTNTYTVHRTHVTKYLVYNML